MRIGVNARLLYTPAMEGMERYICETTIRMALSHPADDFVLFYDRKIRHQLEFPTNVISVIIPLPTRHPILWYIWFELLLPIYLKLYKIDVLYSGDGYLSLSTHVPTTLVIHDLAYKHYESHVSKPIFRYYQKYVPQFLDKAFRIITVSNFVKDDIIRHFNIPEDKIVVAYNALPTLNTSKKSDNIEDGIQKKINSKPYFLYVGSIHPRKNILRLVQAFEIFNTKNNNKYQLFLAGRYAWQSHETEVKIKTNPDILHMGYVSETEKKLLLENAFCLVYVSLFEGFGIPVIEAMASGVPVITSDISSMPEVAGDAALLTDPNDAEAIAACMEKLVSDQSLYFELREKGQKRSKEFDWDESAQKIYTALFQSVRK